MRKLVIISLLAAFLCGCGEINPDTALIEKTTQAPTLAPTLPRETEAPTTNPPVTERPTFSETVSVTESETIPEQSCISINSHTISKDYDGNPILVIEYAFTNIDDKPKSFTFSVQDSVFQNGIECSSTVFGCDEVDSQQQLNDVQPGFTYNLKVAYALQDMTTATVVVTDLWGDETYIEQDIDLGGGAGHEQPTVSADASPLKITNYFLSKDYDGKDVLVVDYQYTNIEDEAEAFIYEFSDSAFQNGIECDSSVFGCDDIDSQSQMSEIQPGVSISVKIGYHIQDMSNVNIVVKKLFTSSEVLNETIALQ